MLKTMRLCLAGLLFLGALVHAELRPPTAAEKKALDNYVAIMNKVLDQFQSDDWDESVDYSIDDASVNTADPDSPLDIDELMERTYNVRRDSARFQTLILPKLQALNGGDMQAKVKAGREAQDLMHVKVSVHFNVPNAGVDPAPPANKDLQVPGAAYAYKINNASGIHGSAYLLLFGNWRAAKWDASSGYYRFPFQHKQLTPYIENVRIEIYGADDRIQELLHKIDWNEVNNALTR